MLSRFICVFCSSIILMGAQPLQDSLLDLQEEHQHLSARHNYKTSYEQVLNLLQSERMDPVFKDALTTVLNQYFPPVEPDADSKEAREYVKLLSEQIREFYTLLQFARLGEIEKFNEVCARMIAVQPRLLELASPFMRASEPVTPEQIHTDGYSEAQVPVLLNKPYGPLPIPVMTPAIVPSNTSSLAPAAGVF